MPSTYSTNLGIELIGASEQSGTWGNTTNNNLGTLLEQAISGYVTQTITDGADTTITIPNGASGVARNMSIEMTGTLTAPRNLIVPANKKLYFVYNNTTGNHAVTVKVSGQTGISVPAGYKTLLVSNGTDVVSALSYLPHIAAGTAGFSQLALTAPLPATSGGTGLSSPGSSGNILTSNGTTWTSAANPPAFPSGTRLLFQQTSAPTGWTKDTTATYNDSAIRVTTSTVGTGGADNFSTLFGTSKSTAGYTLQTADIPAHSHAVNDPTHNHTVNDPTHNHTVNDPTHSHYVPSGGQQPGYNDAANYGSNWSAGQYTNGAYTGIYLSGAYTGIYLSGSLTGIFLSNTGGGGSHSHTLNNMNLKYSDVIIATKN